jgi:hypothetical protein
MLTQSSEKTLSRLLLIGPAFVTLFVSTQSVTDPVNVTKFFVFGGLAFALIASVPGKSFRSLWSAHLLVVSSVIAFFLASLNSLVQSDAPISQSLYGIYGRNNGFILYLFLILSFISVLMISKRESFNNIVKSLLVAGVLNIAYCLWVISFGDFVGWTNPYGNILGTLGNPNFIGAFLGMFSSILMTAIFFFKRNSKIFWSSIFALSLTLFEILQSNAIQGRVLFVAGFGINTILYLWFNRTKLWIISLTFGTFLTIGILAVLGTLQKGPFVELLYKDSVSLRGQYWYAGIQMGFNNFVSGVGFDSYGDWYRHFRRTSALIRPGIDTASNTAHNVYIDLFAFGGAPLLLSYLLINIAVLISIVKVLRRRSNFDFVFVSLAGSWVCYQLQSIISINQVGLAIWGWILGAALIAFERSSSEPDDIIVSRGKTRSREEIVSPSLRASLGLVVGCLIAAPPLAADMKWRSAQVTQDAAVVEQSLKPSYLNPNNTFRYLNTVGLFHDSNLDDLALTYARQAIEFNPQSFDSWRLFTYIRGASEQEVQQALLRMHELDPLNPNIVTETR